MVIAVVCRRGVYERLTNPIKQNHKDVEISEALSTWNEALMFIQTHSVTGIIVEEGVQFFEQIKSFPFPKLTFSGNLRGYSNELNQWINVLKVEMKSVENKDDFKPDPKEDNKEEAAAEEDKEAEHTVLLYSKLGEVHNLISTIDSTQVFSKENLEFVLHDVQETNPEVVLIEESIVDNEELTTHEQKIETASKLLHKLGIHFALLLHERENKQFFTRLIDKGIYNFSVKNSVSLNDIKSLLFTQKSRGDVEEYYEVVKEKIPVQPIIPERVPEPEPEPKPVQPNPPKDVEIQTGKIGKIKMPDLSGAIKQVPGFLSKLGSRKQEQPASVKSSFEHPTTRVEPEEVKVEQKVDTPDEPAPVIEEERKRKGDRKKEEEIITPFVYPIPHRLLIYSPKGGAGATTIAVHIAESSKNNSVGVVEISNSYGQLAGKLNLELHESILDVEDGMEEIAICDNKYLCSPWVFPIKQNFNETMLMSWLNKAERAFPGRMVVADLKSQSSPIILMYAHQWATKVIWVVQDTDEHFGLADLQLSNLKKSGDSWKKISLIVQEVTGNKKLPWEETLDIPVIGILPRGVGSKEWKKTTNQSVAEHLGI